MKGTRDRMKRVETMATEAGLVVERVAPGPHYKFYLRNDSGVKRILVVGSSSSDRNLDRIVGGQLKRIAREQPQEA